MFDRIPSGPAPAHSKRIAAAVLAASLAAACSTVGPPSPEIGYVAEVRVRIGADLSIEPTLVAVSESYSRGKRRREAEVGGRAVVSIDRPDLRITWILHPEERSFEEFAIWSPNANLDVVPDPFGPRSGAVFERLGTDAINGIDADKYSVKSDALSGVAWFSRDRVPLRFDGIFVDHGSPRKLDVEYKGIERRGPAGYLFVVPPNYEGYEKRKQRNRTNVSDPSIDDARRRLEAEQRGRSGGARF
jgi:hypothetical protein